MEPSNLEVFHPRAESCSVTLHSSFFFFNVVDFSYSEGQITLVTSSNCASTSARLLMSAQTTPPHPLPM